MKTETQHTKVTLRKRKDLRLINLSFHLKEVEKKKLRQKLVEGRK